MTTRKTYELPAPSRAVKTYDGSTHNEWFVDNSIEPDDYSYSDGIVSRYPQTKTICIDMCESGQLKFGYDEAERVALAMLAAVEEAKTNQDSN